MIPVFGGYLTLTHDKQLFLLDPSCGIVSLGFPIKKQLEHLDSETMFLRVLKGHLVMVGDKNKMFRCDLQDASAGWN